MGLLNWATRDVYVQWGAETFPDCEWPPAEGRELVRERSGSLEELLLIFQIPDCTPRFPTGRTRERRPAIGRQQPPDQPFGYHKTGSRSSRNGLPGALQTFYTQTVKCDANCR